MSRDVNEENLYPDGFLETLEEIGRTLPGRGRGDLGEAVAALSEVYTRDRGRIDELPDEIEALQARLRFFLPRDLPKVMGPLSELKRASALPPGPTWRVLDLGAGLGTTSLGAALFASRHAPDVEKIEIRAYERSERALALFGTLAKRARSLGLPTLELVGSSADFTTVPEKKLGRGYDLVLMGLVLNELEGGRMDSAARAELLERLLSLTHEGGALVVLEPALRETTRRLHEVRDALISRAAGAHVFAPCVRSGACPMLETKKDWCHEEMPLTLPETLAEVAHAAGLRYSKLTYSYLTLRRRPGTLREALAPHEGELYRVVSQPMPSKGKLELFGCGEPGRDRLMRLDRHLEDANEGLDEARRGDLIRVEGAERKGERLKLGPTAGVSRVD